MALQQDVPEVVEVSSCDGARPSSAAAGLPASKMTTPSRLAPTTSTDTIIAIVCGIELRIEFEGSWWLVVTNQKVRHLTGNRSSCQRGQDCVSTVSGG